MWTPHVSYIQMKQSRCVDHSPREVRGKETQKLLTLFLYLNKCQLPTQRQVMDNVGGALGRRGGQENTA